jgi:AcrR family transcriptional regulator
MASMTVTKGDRTRQRLVEVAAPIFNQRGYRGVAMSSVMAEAGLEKGGVYNHFASKDDLALAAFDHNTEIVGALIRDGLENQTNAVDRLVAILDVYRAFAHDPPFPGGCPILNTTVEADASLDRLRQRARETLVLLQEGTVQRIVELGIQRGELPDHLDAASVATVLIAGIEGGLLLNHAHDDPDQFDRVADHLTDHLRSLDTRRDRTP